MGSHNYRAELRARSAGANHIGGVEYQSSELRKYTDEAGDAAAKAAREKADALAKALGNQIGKTYSIEEVQQSERPTLMEGWPRTQQWKQIDRARLQLRRES